jgi:hypothetical protein
MYHFFEGIQGKFFNCDLLIGAQVWRSLHRGIRIQTIGPLCAL